MRKKAQDSSYTGVDNDRMFLPYEAMRKDFPMPGEFNTADSISAIIVSPYENVASELGRIVDEEGKINFEVGGPVENEIRSILSRNHDFDPRDVEAVSIWNTALSSIMISKVIKGMDEFFAVV